MVDKGIKTLGELLWRVLEEFMRLIGSYYRTVQWKS